MKDVHYDYEHRQTETIELGPEAKCLGYVCCDNTGLNLRAFVGPEPKFVRGEGEQVVATYPLETPPTIKPGTELVLTLNGTPVAIFTGDNLLSPGAGIQPLFNPEVNFLKPPFGPHGDPKALICLGVYSKTDTITTYPST